MAYIKNRIVQKNNLSARETKVHLFNSLNEYSNTPENEHQLSKMCEKFLIFMTKIHKSLTKPV